jgi:hypothetical protein
VTLDFQGADLRAVLRTFAEISNGLNIVIDPSIQGTVDVSLRDVPWDQALDIILRANKLGYSVEGNIVRIVPLTCWRGKRRAPQAAEAQALAGELRTLTVPVSYAKAADLVPVITRSTLSSRGDVQVDPRTNTLIIRDLADRLQTRATWSARSIAAAAGRDRSAHRAAQPQQRARARHPVGLQRQGRSAVGTSTGLAFPSSGGLTAGTGGVNRAAPSAVGLALGSINGALNLDVTCARSKRRQGPHPVDAARRDAEQRRSGNHAGLADSDSDGVEQHRHGDVQGRGADAARHAADHRVEHRDHAHLRREGRAELHADDAGAADSVDRHAARRHHGADGRRRDDGDRRHLHARRADAETRRRSAPRAAARLAVQDRTRIDDSDELLIFITPRIAK